MKKVVLWTTGGFGLAVICGLMGLAHLSASIITLTVFCRSSADIFWFGVLASSGHCRTVCFVGFIPLV